MTTTHTVSFDAIDQGVVAGRRLRSDALRSGVVRIFGSPVRWLVSTTRAAIGRRASSHLGCADCGDMMRA